jgi:hypothetical protein
MEVSLSLSIYAVSTDVIRDFYFEINRDHLIANKTEKKYHRSLKGRPVHHQEKILYQIDVYIPLSESFRALAPEEAGNPDKAPALCGCGKSGIGDKYLVGWDLQ